MATPSETLTEIVGIIRSAEAHTVNRTRVREYAYLDIGELLDAEGCLD